MGEDWKEEEAGGAAISMEAETRGILKWKSSLCVCNLSLGEVYYRS